MKKFLLVLIAAALIGCSSSDTVSNDDLLKPYLEASVDNRLRNIVSTIQVEQNAIIREPIAKNVIVQGVAGSGKTTVALHRIAYLVYNNREKINPEQYLSPKQLYWLYHKDLNSLSHPKAYELDIAQSWDFLNNEIK